MSQKSIDAIRAREEAKRPAHVEPAPVESAPKAKKPKTTVAPEPSADADVVVADISDTTTYEPT
jgi:hypothetical protein